MINEAVTGYMLSDTVRYGQVASLCDRVVNVVLRHSYEIVSG